MSIPAKRFRWTKPSRTTSAASRLYNDRRWKKASREFLAMNPLCAIHEKQGKTVPAKHTDHIKPHRGDVALFWDVGNWQPLCESCNALKARGKV